MKKLTSKEKGVLYLPHSLPCDEPLPKAAFTEWLRLSDPASILSVVEDLAKNDGSAKRVVIQTFRKERTNLEWLEKEKARCKKANPSNIYEIVKSTCGNFGCLCKYSPSYARRKKSQKRASENQSFLV